MLLAWLVLITGLTISAVAIYYSVVGLSAIFAAASLPIIIMGTTLEVGKLVGASWLKANWTRAPNFIKYYMGLSVLVLMLITSIGTFGFLSKAHSDQALVGGDAASKLAIYDEKIKIAKDNIETSRKALKQLDDSVEQVMARSTDTRGADKAVALRRSQQKDRALLLSEIDAEQKKITALNEERAPIAAEIRKVEAEVGPIKYIAAFFYGANPDSTLLEKAVTWVIILIVIVFDPLAVAMLIAAQMTFQWHKQEKKDTQHDISIATNDPVVRTDQVDDVRLPEPDVVTNEVDVPDTSQSVKDTDMFDFTKHPYLLKPFVHFTNLKPMVYNENSLATTQVTDSDEVSNVEVDNFENKLHNLEKETEVFLDEAEEDSKKKSYMIKENGQQIVKKA